MTIQIFKDRIEFDQGYKLSIYSDGLNVNGKLRVTNGGAFVTRSQAQGTTSGYSSGGASPAVTDEISKFSFASDGNATDVSNLSEIKANLSGQSSSSSGYVTGGISPALPTQITGRIDKFSFAAGTDATNIGNLSVIRYSAAGQSSTTHGYTSGGADFGSPSAKNEIDRFAFASDGSASDVGDLTVARYQVSGQSSTTDGYTSGGVAGSPGFAPQNVIDKFPFATNSNATDVGDLSSTRSGLTGQSSYTHGYVSGGVQAPTNTIEKFPFATNSNATDVGDLTVGKDAGTGQSAVTSGYFSGGSPYVSTIQKFSFTTDGNASNVGNLLGSRAYGAGQQV